MSRKIKYVWEHYLTKEIAIEFKACLYFFSILFYYCMYRLAIGNSEASILHMAEMIFLTYGMGYVQVYLLSGFDEGEQFKGRELFYTFLCSTLYALISYFGRWFDRNIGVSAGFWLYMIFLYLCVFYVYKSKRRIDEKILNEDLKTFQERRKNEEGN